MSTPKKKKPRTRHTVNVGDVVKFYSPVSASAGFIGAVKYVINKRYVVLKTEGERYERKHMLWVVETSKPRGTDSSGEKRWLQSAFITEVLYRRREYIPEQPKPGPVVLHTMDQLREHLESDRAAEKVVFIPVETERNAA